MTTDPWTSDDPQPGDFDGDLATLDPRHADSSAGRTDAKLTVLVSVEGDDADLLEQIAESSGKTPAAVVSDLIRAAVSSP